MSIRNKLRDSGLALQNPGPKTPVAAPPPPPPPPAVPAAPDDVPKAQRPAALRGLDDFEEWLRKESAARLGELVSDKTRAEYRRNGGRLEKTRAPGQPVDLADFAGRGSTYYAYRAAVRYHAAEQAAVALRDFERARKTKNPAAREEARQRMFNYGADLVTYARDKTPGLPTPKEIATGLADVKPGGVPAKVRAAGNAATSARETSKLKAANAINRKLPMWREVLWARLTHVKSPWLDHAAVASLSGARPEELQTATYERLGDDLRIEIKGAKVSAEKGREKGQGWRKLVIKDDGSSEFKHLFSKAKNNEPKTLVLPSGVKDYPDSFSAALARAGKQVFPAGCPRMSGYVYRHSFASDLKADGLPREQIAAALGHAVTKTQDTYGRAAGGRAGARSLSVTCERAIKQTHDTRYTTPAPAATVAPAASVTFTTPSFGDLGL